MKARTHEQPQTIAMTPLRRKVYESQDVAIAAVKTAKGKEAQTIAKAFLIAMNDIKSLIDAKTN